ncbi:hypothetical protein E2I00_008633, partial [Balaenoptera physalus]
HSQWLVFQKLVLWEIALFQPICDGVTWIVAAPQFPAVVCVSVVLLFVPWVPILGGHFSDVSVFTSQISLLIAFICVRSSLWTSYSAYSYFEVVTICNLIMILAFYLVHLFRLYRVLTCISWPLSELLHYLIGTLLLLIASIVAASKSYSQSRLVAGAIFGFLATFLCLASVWLSYKISCVTQSTDAAV